MTTETAPVRRFCWRCSCWVYEGEHDLVIGAFDPYSVEVSDKEIYQARLAGGAFRKRRGNRQGDRDPERSRYALALGRHIGVR